MIERTFFFLFILKAGLINNIKNGILDLPYKRVVSVQSSSEMIPINLPHASLLLILLELNLKRLEERDICPFQQKLKLSSKRSMKVDS